MKATNGNAGVRRKAWSTKTVLAVVCSTVLFLESCSATLSRSPDTREARPWSMSLREGPVTVGANILLDPTQQQARFGRTVEPALFTRVVPVEIGLENIGDRPRTIRSSEMTLILWGGYHLTPMPSADVARLLQESYDALARVRIAPEYPIAEAAMKTEKILCREPNLLCLLPLPFAYVGGLVDTGRIAAARAQQALALRRTKASLTTLLADLGGRERLEEVSLGTGERVSAIVYFPVGADQFQKSETIALAVRFHDNAQVVSPVVTRLPLRREPPAASY